MPLYMMKKLLIFEIKFGV